MGVKLLTEHNLEFLSLKGGCKGSFEYTVVKVPNCWKSNVAPQFKAFQFLRKSLYHQRIIIETIYGGSYMSTHVLFN